MPLTTYSAKFDPKKLFFLLLGGVLTLNCFSQNIAINSTGVTGDPSSMLDITSTTSGLLIPRMTRTERVAISATNGSDYGLLVYQTDAFSAAEPIGFWYWDGIVWKYLFSNNGGNAGWGTLGNANTIDGTHFLGTTDNVPLNFSVNNQKAGRIASNGPTFFGYQAGNANTDLRNTAMGYQALTVNTSGQYNTATGYRALYSNTASHNTAIGGIALYSNTTGVRNTATGLEAIYSNTTGSNNTAAGWQSLQYSTTGNNNVAMGVYALRNNSTGSSNTAIGHSALYSDAAGATGDHNVAAGFEVLYSNLAGDNNTATGDYSLRSNSTGNYNTACGYGVLLYNQTGSNNTAMGAQAGYGSTTNSYSNNSLFGYRAGYSLTTGSDNVFIGYQAGYNETVGSNKLFIDNSNTATPLIYGDFSTDRLGINNNAPAATLDIGGTAKLGTNGTVLTKVIKTTVNSDPPSIPANSTVDFTIAVANAATPSSVVVSPSATWAAGIGILHARVSAAGTVEIRLLNNTAGALDPGAAQDFYLTIIE